MDSPAPGALPLFPIELKREILRFCDQPSLGQASLCSFALLELAGPLLYDEVTVQGLSQLVRLLGEPASRHPPPPPLLAPFLSLSRTRVLNYLGRVEDQQWVYQDFPQHDSRNPRLLLPTVNVRFPEDDSRSVDWACDLLLALVQPRRLTFTFDGPNAPIWIPLEPIDWSSLDSVSFDGCLPVADFVLSETVSPLPSLLTTHQIEVTFEVTRYDGLEKGEDQLEQTIACIGNGSGMPDAVLNDLDLLDWVRDVTLRVKDKRQQLLCEQVVEKVWEEQGLGEEEIRRIMERIVFVVEE